MRPASLVTGIAAVLATATGFALGADAPAAAPPTAAQQPAAIFVMRVDGSQVRRLPRVEGFRFYGAPRWSHDGQRLAMAVSRGADDAWRVFTIGAEGAEPTDLGPGEFPDWSPDDKQLAFSVGAGAVIKQGTWVENTDRRGREWLASGVAPRWSPDGSRLAMLNDKTLVAFDLVESVERPLANELTDDILPGFDWSPDGTRFAFVAHRDGQGQLWIVDLSDAHGAPKRPRSTGDLDGHVAWSPNAKRLAVTLAGRIHILEVDGSDPPRPIAGQEGTNRMPAWSPDGARLAFVSTRATGEEASMPASHDWKLVEVGRHAKGSIVYGLGFTPDGRQLVMGGDPADEGVQLLDLATGKARDLGGQGIRISMFPDGRRFATSWLDSRIQIVAIETGDVLREFDSSGTVRGMSVSKDGRRLVAGGLDHLLHVWNVETGEMVSTFDKHTDWITRACFSPDGREVISAGHDQRVRVWDAQTGEQRLELKHPGVVWGLAVSPDGRQILTGTGGSINGRPEVMVINEGTNNAVRLWDTATGTLVRAMLGHTHAVFTLDISPDGRLAVSGGWDGTIRLWDLESGHELSRIEGGQGGVMCVMFSPDGRLVVAGGGVARLVSDIIDYPDEQLRVYRVTDGQQAPEAPFQQ